MRSTVVSVAYVALGSNLGRRERAVLAAARALCGGGAARLVGLSSLYESPALGIPGAPPFINAVAQLATLLPPLDLLQRLQAIEVKNGRTGGHWQSREIDLDLIAMGDEIVAGDRLTLPHPRFHQRAFVLVPLREVTPGFVCPRTGRPVDELVAALPEPGDLVRISGRSLTMRG
jgi:2-amino-4-hydroxy-6-hydroxymethyldihydropteridine diphosphokinase